MKFVPTIVALLTFSAITYSANITIYRWVDDNNVVHFSQNQPEHSNFTEITMQKFKHKANANKVDSSQLGELTISNNKKENNVSENKTARCLTAKNNLATLEKFELIQYKTDSGERKLLTAKEKKDQLTLNKQQVDLFCKN